MTLKAAIVLLLVAFNCVPLQAEAKNGLTIEWIFGKEREQTDATPVSVWLPNGKLLFYDGRMPETTRTFELFDPSAGKRQPALDMKKAIQSLKSLLGEKDTPAVLDWPDSFDLDEAHAAFDEEGAQAFYVFVGDIFLLDMASAKFRRVTQTDSKEEAVSFSPDGKKICFARANDLYVYDIQTAKEERLTTDGSETLRNGTLSWVYWEEIFGHSDLGYWWSSDSQSIAFLHTDESKVGTMNFTDFEPYQPRVIQQRYPKAGEPVPSVRLAILNIENPKITWVNYPADSYEYIVRVGWLSDNQKVSVQTMNRAQNEVTLFLADRVSGRASFVLKEKDDAWTHIYSPYFLKDGKRFLWISERSGFAHLYLYNIDGKLQNPVTRGNWSLRPFGGFLSYGDSPLVCVDEKSGWVYFTASENSAIEQQFYRVQLDGTQFQRLSMEDGFHNVSVSDNALYYTDTHANISMLPSLTVHRAEGTTVQTLVGSQMAARFPMVYPSLFNIPAGDGFSLPAQITKPADFNPRKKYPVIVYVYGGPSFPSVQNNWNANDWSDPIYYDQILLENGYIVFSVDNRSSAAISHALETKMKGQMYGDIELNDLLDAVKWLKQQPFVDRDRIGIWGWSGGGTYTLLALTHSKEFKAGIAIAPVTDWHYYDAKWTELFMKTPKENAAGYEKTSLVKRASNLHGRLLMIYGSHDDNVHPQNSQAFQNELIRAGILFDAMVYPMRKHDIKDTAAKIHLYKTMLEFWKRNL